ncbi:MAG: cupin domain-containing protein [Haloarculaceae archaeon]
MERTSVASVEWREYDHGENAFRRKDLSTDASADREGDEDIGCSLYELPPGKRSWPYHYHTGNAEAAYVLSGSGIVRTTADGGDVEPEPVEAGDYLVFPAGDDGGHQFANESDEPLRYLMVSTMNEPDVTVYPEQDKVGVFAGAPPGGRSGRDINGFWRREDAIGYWDE